MANDTFSALADPTRRGILELLAGNPELSATQIYERFDVSPQAISQHLKILRETQLVRVEKRAQQRIYSLNIDPVKDSSIGHKPSGSSGMEDLMPWTASSLKRWPNEKPIRRI
ncbi:metalloregulator ArsR/SmtB family transcription factor, partial [Paenibacillus sp. AR247]|uniref:ArsR/SmtB family transcription factor n=1 Tax=Paenibacillus sp. AR247 TaxID=1631599 RepID=UPI000D429E96